ncbi:hypothetical protein GJAV_G00122100 [Gymnothorax javanicus]|nr:hypothetical protein GJAV_G00122100 [Gymnothorax javanicus]
MVNAGSMCELAARITGGLLRFPDVTVEALGEDEIRLDSVLHGKFTTGRSGLAWLACGPHLEVVQAATAERFSAYCFSGVSESAPNVLAVRDFCWLKRSGLLVGLEETAGSILCLYDLSVSRVIKAVVIPGRITAIEPLVSYGGASTSTQHLHQSLRWFFGVVAVVTDVGHVLLVDLCLDDPSCSQSELEASDLEVVNKSPGEIPYIRERVTQQGRHLCLQLSSPTGTSATALQYVPRTNQLAVGFSDGYLQLWNMKTLKKDYNSQLEGGRVPVYAFTFQEPENDPRNCCYMWAVQSTQDHEGDVVSLHLLQLAFGERKCLAVGKILYEGLEYCEERYSLDLNGTAFPSRAQATNTRLLSCQTIEKFRHHPDRDDSLNEGASPDTSVSMFSWQVKSYGQGRPTTYVGLFDINRWYHAQMPDSLRTGESLHNCPYLAVWSLDSVVQAAPRCPLLDIVVHERTLSRGLPYTCPLPEQFFNPTTYNFDATCLLNAGIVHVTCSGYQKETLSFLKRSASSLSGAIPDGYSRCLMSGLLSPRLGDVQPSILSQEEQLDAILSAAVETSSLGLITGCIKQWMSDEQPSSVVNLRYILEWAWNKVVLAKEELDGICAPLFDCSSNFTDPQTLQLLQHSQRLLGNLSTIFHCLLSEAHQLTQKGLVGLVNKNVVSTLIAQYAQVVLWFCRTGLLPEGIDDDVLQMSRPFYNFPVIKNYYSGRREELQRLSRGKWSSDCLMIDGLVGLYGACLGDLWKRDEGGTGNYPPPTLHALLDMYLLENMEESAKQAVVIYLLLDVMYSLPNKSGTSVESFPTAFAIPIGLVKLVQGFWLLDHHDHENSVELLLHPATSRSLWAWQHGRVLQALMLQAQPALALRYFHTVSPRVSSTCPVTLCLSVLLHNRCIVEAWALLRQHSNKLNMEDLLTFLYESCLELGLVEELLKMPLGLAEQECLERLLQTSGGLQNRELLMVHYLQQAKYVPALQLNQTLRMSLNDPKFKERSNTRNSILDQYGKILPRVQRKMATERAKPYHHPSAIRKEVSRPQPLSTLPKRPAAENVLSRANFLSGVLTKIGEVWEGKAEPSPQKSFSPRASGPPVTSACNPTTDLAEAFVGTPVRMTSKRMSRILDLVVRPSSQTSPEGRSLVQTPQASTQSMASPAALSTLRPSGFLGSAKAPELSLLQTPLVVKKARALAATGPVFPGFTPQSILRSSLRPTPLGTPSASPPRSASPPLRPKESRITFEEEEEEKGAVPWNNGIPAETDISRLSRNSPHPEAGVEGWNGQHPGEEDAEEEDSLRFALLRGHRVRDEAGETESCASERRVVADAEEDVPLAADISDASTHYLDATMELRDTSAADGHEDGDLDMGEEDEVVFVNVKAVVPGGEEQDEAPVELEEEAPNLGREEAGSSLAQEVVEPSLGLKVAEHDTEQEVAEESVMEPDSEKEVAEPSAEQELMKPHTEQDLVERDSEQEMEEPHSEQEMAPQTEQEVSEPDQNLVEPDAGQEVVSPDTELEVVELLPVQKEAEVELNSDQRLMDKSPEQEEVEQNLEQEETKQAVLHIGLDEYVERHLFGDDFSPPLTRASIRQASQSWAITSDSECSFNTGKEAPQAALTAQKSVTSVSSGADSHSVVSLNDSEELSEASPAEDSGTTSEEEGSGNDVEIIGQVEGNGRQQPRDASMFQAEAPLGSGHLPEAVESVGEEGAEELAMVNPELEAGEEPLVCYTELKPSDTLLVPLDPEDEQNLGLHKLQEGAIEAGGPYADGSDGFTLRLETESLENGQAGSMEDPDSPLVLMELPQSEATLEHIEDQEFICSDKVRADSREDVSSVSARQFGFTPQTLEESVVAKQEDGELPLSVVSTGQEPVICDAPMGQGLTLVESEGSAMAPEESNAVGDEDEPVPTEEEVESIALAQPVEPDPVMDRTEFAAALEQAESAIVKDEESSFVVGEVDSVSEEAITDAVVEGTRSGALAEEASGDVVEATTSGALDEEVESRPASEEAVMGAVVDEVGSHAQEVDTVAAVEEAANVDVVAEEANVALLEEATTGEAEEAGPGAGFEEVPPVPIVEEAEPASEVKRKDPVSLLSEAHRRVDLAEETPVKSMEKADISHSSGSKIISTSAETRRMTRQRKTITLPSPIEEVDSDLQSTVEVRPLEEDSKMQLTPSRSTRRAKREVDSQVLLTPRRSTRASAKPKPPTGDEAAVSNTTSSDVETKSSKMQTPQSAVLRRGTRKTRNSQLDIEEAVESVEIELPALPTTGTKSTRRTRASVTEVPGGEAPALPETKEIHRSGMKTRKSSRGLSLALETTQEQIMGLERKGVTPRRSQRSVGRVKAVESTKGSEDTAERPPTPNLSRRMTRSSHYIRSTAITEEKVMEEHLGQGKTLDLEPGTEAAGALTERLRDEGAEGSTGEEIGNGGTTIIRARRRTARAPSPPPLVTEAPNGAEELLLDGEAGGLEAAVKKETQSKAEAVSRRTRGGKASETDSSSPRDSLSPPTPQTRRKTRGKRAGSPTQNKVSQIAFSPPKTRRRHPAVSTASHATNNVENRTEPEVVQKPAETAKPRRKKATGRSPPPVKIKLISPMPSPAELAPGVERKERGEPPLQRMNLRRKRLMDTIFPKPVKRRKMP